MITFIIIQTITLKAWCGLCSSLHNKSEPVSVIPDLHKWWATDAKCFKMWFLSLLQSIIDFKMLISVSLIYSLLGLVTTFQLWYNLVIDLFIKWNQFYNKSYLLVLFIQKRYSFLFIFNLIYFCLCLNIKISHLLL